MIPKKWIKIGGLALSLPSTILGSVLLIKFIESKKLIGHNLSNILIIVFIIYFLGLIVYYALRNKK